MPNNDNIKIEAICLGIYDYTAAAAAEELNCVLRSQGLAARVSDSDCVDTLDNESSETFFIFRAAIGKRENITDYETLLHGTGVSIEYDFMEE